MNEFISKIKPLIDILEAGSTHKNIIAIDQAIGEIRKLIEEEESNGKA